MLHRQKRWNFTNSLFTNIKTMKVMEKVKNAMMILGLSLFVVACSDDDDDNSIVEQNLGRMSIEATATYSPTGAKNTTNSAAWVELSRFAVNFEEIELEYGQQVGDDNFYGSDDDIKLRGPFELELLLPVHVPIAEFRVPNGRVDEIEFKFDKNANTDSDLYGKSVHMEGMIDGVDFVFWHDFEEDIELDFDPDNSNAIIAGDMNWVLINFDLTSVIHATPEVDLSTAVDGNGDGIIEINPQDPDGNRELAESIKQALKNRIELIEDLEI